MVVGLPDKAAEGALASNADDGDESIQTGKVVGVTGIKRQPVGMGGRSDEKVGNASPVRPAVLGNRSHNLSVTAGRGDIEGKWFEGGLDLLQPSLAASALNTGRGQVRPRSKFREGDGANRGHVWKSGRDAWVAPVNDDGGIQETRRHLQPLVDGVVEVGPELGEIDAGPGGGERYELGLRDVAATSLGQRPKFGDWDAIAGNDEGLPAGDRFDHPGIVVSQFALRNRPCHLA